jgi:putative endonuclease
MAMYYVYILECDDKSYYTGVTNNLQRRLAEHSTGKNPQSYTATRLPVKLVFRAVFQYVNEAIAFEKQLKRWTRAKKEALIHGNFTKLKELSTCKNKTHSSSWKENGFGGH